MANFKTSTIASTLIFFFLIPTISSAQRKIQQYIQTNTKTINSIVNKNDQFNDWETIAQAIGDARIVMLGEQDHGDAPSFLAKNQLIQYLHEKKGFNVLAFESDWWSLTQGAYLLQQDSSQQFAFLQNNIYPIWTLCKSFQPTMQYIQQQQESNTPLHVAGFDIYPHGEHAVQHFSQWLQQHKELHQIPCMREPKTAKQFHQLVDSVIHYGSQQSSPADTTLLHQLINHCLRIHDELTAATQQDSSLPMAINNLIALSKHLLIKDKTPHANKYTWRDAQMAQNLIWLANTKYPTEKIIVWAANGHIIKNAPDAVEPAAFRHASLGQFIDQDPILSKQTYTLAFTSFQGNAGRITMKGQYSFPTASRGSVEYWMQQKGRPFSFIDLVPFKKQNPGYEEWFYMNGESHFRQRGSWTKCFDGIFFIENMFPCEMIDR